MTGQRPEEGRSLRRLEEEAAGEPGPRRGEIAKANRTGGQHGPRDRSG